MHQIVFVFVENPAHDEQACLTDLLEVNSALSIQNQ